ncbi:MAG: translation initiation factor IF-2 N-terminal domain-containing protein, partial [Myxococcota bacterium]
MSKKRVHEIAKELKEKHGIEFDNKQVVTELVSLGYDVKSHSSSLEDDQAIAAIQKIVDKRKPKAAPPPVAPKGFVVRRKVGDNVVSTAMPASHKPEHHEPSTAPVAPPPAAPPAPVEAKVEPEPKVELPPDSHTPVATAVPLPNMPAATEQVPVQPAPIPPAVVPPTPAVVEPPPAVVAAPPAPVEVPAPAAV